MKSFGVSLLFFTVISSVSVAQKLKKADRLIVSNLKTHVDNLAAAGNGQLFSGYISKQFQRYGLKPKGDLNSWYQQFEIYDGKEVLKSNYFNINNQELQLFEDYFPFPFSANNKVENSVAIALAEDGYPWFKDINDIVGDENTKGANISELIRNKAKSAAGKGATALIVYNTGDSELSYDSMDRSEPVAIPVVFLTRKAYQKYCSDESAVVDIKMNVELKEKKHFSNNVVAFADNGADSTVLVTAVMSDKDNIATLLELARLAKTIQPKKKNYLFAALSPEQGGVECFKSNAPLNLSEVSYTLSLDSLNNMNDTALELVKQSIDSIKTHSR